MKIVLLFFLITYAFTLTRLMWKNQPFKSVLMYNWDCRHQIIKKTKSAIKLPERKYGKTDTRFKLVIFENFARYRKLQNV